MKRLITHLAFGAGVLLLLFAMFAFVRGFWTSDETRAGWSRSDGGGMYIRDSLALFTSRPVCAVQFERTRAQLTQRIERSLGFSTAHGAQEPIPFGVFVISSPQAWQRLAFQVEVEDQMSRSAFGPGGEGRWRASFVVPTWFIALLGGVIAARPAWSLWRRRRKTLRTTKGLCPSCAYDLRGAAHERCPECGASVAVPAAQA